MKELNKQGLHTMKIKLKVNFQKILSLFLASVLSLSLLILNVSAFSFNGGNRSISDIYSDWFVSTRDFLNGTSSFEEWRNANIRFQTDLIGSNLFPGTDSELRQYIAEIEEHLSELEGNTGFAISDSFVDVLGNLLDGLGMFDFRSQFEQWYQDKYGKKYGKHDDAFGKLPEDAPSGYSYYLDYYNSSQTYQYQMVINYTGFPIPVYRSDDGDLYFIGSSIVCTYRKRHRYTSRGEWQEWLDWGSEQSGTLGKLNFYLRGDGSGNIVIDTSLPFDYTTSDGDDDWGDGSGGGSDGGSDDSSGDGSGDGSGDNELVAPVLTIPELIDLLTDLEQDLKDSDVDTENPNEGIEIKITQLINEMHNDLSIVIYYLKLIYGKISEFFNNFIDTFENFFEKLGEFFQSIFVPSDDCFSNFMLDIQAEFDDAFSFAGDIRLLCDTAVNAYKNGSTSAPDISVDVDGVGSHNLDLSFFDSNMPLIRSILCAFIYCSFAFNLYRRIPCYISGGGER